MSRQSNSTSLFNSIEIYQTIIPSTSSSTFLLWTFLATWTRTFTTLNEWKFLRFVIIEICPVITLVPFTITKIEFRNFKFICPPVNGLWLTCKIASTRPGRLVVGASFLEHLMSVVVLGDFPAFSGDLTERKYSFESGNWEICLLLYLNLIEPN